MSTTPDNTGGTPEDRAPDELSPDRDYHGQLVYGGDSDSIEITLIKKTRYEITLDGAPGMALKLAFTSGDGRGAVVFEGEATPNGSVLTVTAFDTGVGTLTISGKDSNAIGSYTVSMKTDKPMGAYEDLADFLICLGRFGNARREPGGLCLGRGKNPERQPGDDRPRTPRDHMAGP